jgi:hypothetical protein
MLVSKLFAVTQENASRYSLMNFSIYGLPDSFRENGFAL